MIDGFIVIDKPAGITSHDVVSRVRRILGTRKVGHTGTLDPFATGVLPVAVNEGTKAIPFLDEGIKCYEAVMQLGISTDTLDITGTVLTVVDPCAVSQEELLEVLNHFTGTLKQIPPMYSAIKQNGQPLYKLARQGIEVERKSRQIEITALELLSYQRPLATFRVVCSRGTYVRSLAGDIGARLGCGATLQELRRTASGSFTITSAVTLDELETAVRNNRAKDLCISPYAALAHLPDLQMNEDGCARIRHGRSPECSDMQTFNQAVTKSICLMRLSRNNSLLAVAQYEPCPEGRPRIVLKRVFN